jgi:hypothetical protein
MNTQSTIQLTPYEAVGHYFMLGGEPLDVKSYPYLKAVLNTRCPEVGLFTARQVAKCQPLGTYVVMANGSITTLGEIKPGVKVLSIGKDFKSTVREVLNVFDNGEAECFEVTTKGGAVLQLTADHRLRTAVGYTTVRDLKIDDTLACAETAGVFQDEVPEGGETRIILTAYMLGDGCLGTSKHWSFTKANQECLDEVRELDPENTRTEDKKGTPAKAIAFRVAAPIRAWMTQDGSDGKYSHEKEIPAWVFNLSRKHTALFISRLWATDGSMKVYGQSLACTYTSTSHIMLRQIQSLLRKLGIRTTSESFIPTCKGKKHRRAYRLRVAGYDAVIRFYSEVGHVPGKPPVYTQITTERRSTTITAPLAFNDLLRAAYAPFAAIPKRNRTGGIFDRGLKWPLARLSQDKMREWISAFKEMNLDTAALEPFDNGGVWWDTIDSIRSIGVQRVYDMEVEEDHNYLIDTGIVSHNSTTLAMKLVLKAINEPQSSQIYIAPLQDQAEVFSMQRLRDFILDSPIVKDGFFAGPGVVDQVFRKIFSNRSIIACGYAQRTADRLRGRSCGSILLDEVQDIMAEVIPIIKEMAFRVKNPSYWYCGTPKSFNNHMEGMRARSTGNEWGVKCQHTGCKKWNLNWNEKNIGNLGVICEHCGLPLNTDAGQWIASRRMDIEKGKDAKVTMESFRIPQLIVKPIMDIPRKWIEIIGKLKNYSAEQFNNEVLGLPFDSGSQPITLEQLMACCISTRHNVLPDPRDTSLPPLVMGVDWAFIGENSYTVVVIGGWEPYPTKFNVYYYHVYKGVETDSTRQENDIITMARSLGIRLIGADWGAGHVQNLHLINALGEEHVAQLWHTGMNGAARKAQRAKWEPKTRKWHLARTAVLTDTFENLRRRQVTLPRYEECVEFCDQILAESLEFNDKTNTVRYVNMNPDDCLHALTYAMLAGELLIRGDFAGHDGQASPEMPGSRKPDVGAEDDWGVGHDMYN